MTDKRTTIVNKTYDALIRLPYKWAHSIIKAPDSVDVLTFRDIQIWRFQANTLESDSTASLFFRGKEISLTDAQKKMLLQGIEKCLSMLSIKFKSDFDLMLEELDKMIEKI